MSDDRKKLGWTVWATEALVGLPLLYLASFGPSVWLANHGYVSDGVSEFIATVYFPIVWLHVDGPGPISHAIEWYAELWGWVH